MSFSLCGPLWAGRLCPLVHCESWKEVSGGNLGSTRWSLFSHWAQSSAPCSHSGQGLHSPPTSSSPGSSCDPGERKTRRKEHWHTSRAWMPIMQFLAAEAILGILNTLILQSRGNRPSDQPERLFLHAGRTPPAMEPCLKLQECRLHFLDSASHR